MPLKLSDQDLADIRERWETTIGTKNAKAKEIAADYGVHPNTIEVRARNEEWLNPTEEGELAVAEVRKAIDEVAPDWLSVEDKATMQSEILRLERALAESNAKVDQLRPDTDITARMFETEDDVIAWYGDILEDVAMAEAAQANKRRTERGYNPIEVSVTKEQLVTEARKILAERRAGVGNGPFTRTVKMVNPARNCTNHARPVAECFRHGNLISIPLENQVNNMKGSLYDATERYRKKGFKLTNPMICFAGPCNDPAAVDERGKLMYGGYCTVRHRSLTPAEGTSDGSRSIIGSITRENVMA